MLVYLLHIHVLTQSMISQSIREPKSCFSPKRFAYYHKNTVSGLICDENVRLPIYSCIFHSFFRRSVGRSVARWLARPLGGFSRGLEFFSMEFCSVFGSRFYDGMEQLPGRPSSDRAARRSERWFDLKN